MPNTLLFNLTFFGTAIYLITTFVICFVGFSQDWHDKNNLQALNFRKPKMYRIGMAMLGLLMLAMTGVFVVKADDFGGWLAWLWYVPLGILFTLFFAYVAGPQDILIDLEARVCYQTKGWMFHPRKRTYYLTETSSLCACCGGQSCYVFLRIGDAANQRLMLATRSSKQDAYYYGKEIADKLGLPIKATTLQEMGKPI